ncbi:glycosyltransferase family 2 protein [Prosthecobacter sp.]|uniref:glycosyltransferase family 2 protein n=1 Tax=Prosthecobacter sp. TaxID=1965333 RepID=UPI00378517A1
MKRSLTIGMLTYDDFDGVYFTVQSLRLHHPEAMEQVEFLILDNHSESAHGQAVRDLTAWVRQPVRYVPMTGRTGTALRDALFEQAKTPYVLCLDSHVMLAPGALAKLIDFMNAGLDEGNLLQGPLIMDNLDQLQTHMDPVWREGMWGIWGHDRRGDDIEAPPFEIPAHGMGLFACRKESWLGFNKDFHGFGGEECYIHEKFRRAGRKTLCLPFLRWLHRFARPGGIPYPNRWDDRIHNYLLGHAELGLDPEPMIEHFRSHLGKAFVDATCLAIRAGQFSGTESR